MENNLALKNEVDGQTMLKVITGDINPLSPDQKLAYYRARCEASGLDERTAPFQFIKLQGREVLYATKGATDQLASINKIRLEVLSQTTENDVRMVMVRAIAGDGRQTDEMGAVPVAGVKGADLANAYMKAITKAKRRAVLSICGLGMLDETELETIAGATHTERKEIEQPKRKSEAVVVVEKSPCVDVGVVKNVTPTPEVANAGTEEQTHEEMKAVAPTERLISEKQMKRLFAITKASGKTYDAVKAYLEQMGIKSSKEIPVSKYEEVCGWVQSNTDTGELNEWPVSEEEPPL